MRVIVFCMLQFGYSACLRLLLSMCRAMLTVLQSAILHTFATVHGSNVVYMCLPDQVLQTAKHRQMLAMLIIAYTTGTGAPHCIESSRSGHFRHNT